ncbi:YbjN domain-containing protein [Cellulomonas sp. NPDC089187]|uniref:YbjN domain-containing protein n=1 Tax=Cellulomonas sp. NPDC089187 TaxID=3154970 RepID=UPI00344442DB
MGFFTKPDATPAAALAPLTKDRIKAVLDRREMNYGVDDDGDIFGVWDGHLFYFFQLGKSGEYFQSRGRWNRKVGVDQLGALTQIVNQWNAEKLWPKVYVRAEGEVLGVYGEHTVDYEHGITDEQIDQHLACGIMTTLQVFDQLDEAYPAEAAAAKAEEEAQG